MGELWLRQTLPNTQTGRKLSKNWKKLQKTFIQNPEVCTSEANAHFFHCSSWLPEPPTPSHRGSFQEVKEVEVVQLWAPRSRPRTRRGSGAGCCLSERGGGRDAWGAGGAGSTGGDMMEGTRHFRFQRRLQLSDSGAAVRLRRLSDGAVAGGGGARAFVAFFVGVVSRVSRFLAALATGGCHGVKRSEENLLGGSGQRSRAQALVVSQDGLTGFVQAGSRFSLKRQNQKLNMKIKIKKKSG